MCQSRSARCCIQAPIQPVGDRLSRQREIADLAVSLCTLGPREHSGRHRPCIRQAGGLIVDLVRRYVVIFGTRQEKHVLTNERRDLLCTIAGSCSKHLRGRVHAVYMHRLRQTPFLDRIVAERLTIASITVSARTDRRAWSVACQAGGTWRI